MNMTEELLDPQSLKDQTRGRDLFVSVCSAVKPAEKKVSGIITDGAPAMAGERSGLSSLIGNKVSEEGGKANKLHCVIHQPVLCAKHLKYDHAEYGHVVYHTDVRRLSRGSALQRFYSLRGEIEQFSAKKGASDARTIWSRLADLGFLVDTTKRLNALNTSLQGQNATVSRLYSHIQGFGTKLQLFQRHPSQIQPNTTPKNKCDLPPHLKCTFYSYILAMAYPLTENTSWVRPL